MRLKCDFELMEFDSERIAVPVGDSASELHGVIKLNETAEFILNYLKKDTSEEAIVEALSKEYDAPRDVLANDVRQCIEELAQKDMILL